MTINDARQKLISALSTLYDKRESSSISDLVMENITGLKKIDLIIKKLESLPVIQQEMLERYNHELINHRPVQYVLGEAWFHGMKLFVDENVLIPRPETEEIVAWLAAEMGKGLKESPVITKKSLVSAGEGPLRVLDIGTGSGAISIALKKEFTDAEIYACDISKNALEVARRNAKFYKTNIHFIELDFLDREQRKLLPDFDILVSNPPYIPLKEKPSMDLHITEYEPGLALFVPDEQPLIFYEAIADFAKEKMSVTGCVYVEIHEDFSANVKKLFSFKGFSEIEIKKDMQGKDRMIKATMLL